MQSFNCDAVLCRVSKVKWVHLGLLEWLDLRWVFLFAPSYQLEKSDYPRGIHRMSRCLLPTLPRDPQERLVPWESADTLDHQDPLESRDSLVPQERRAPKETRDHLEALARMDPQDWEDSLERGDCLEPLWVSYMNNSDRCQKENLHTDC